MKRHLLGMVLASLLTPLGLLASETPALAQTEQTAPCYLFPTPPPAVVLG